VPRIDPMGSIRDGPYSGACHRRPRERSLSVQVVIAPTTSRPTASTSRIAAPVSARLGDWDAFCVPQNPLHHLCVRGRTIRTLPKIRRPTTANRSDTGTQEASLDHDPPRIPCVSRENASNATVSRHPGPDTPPRRRSLADRLGQRGSTSQHGSFGRSGSPPTSDGRILAGVCRRCRMGEQSSTASLASVYVEPGPRSPCISTAITSTRRQGGRSDSPSRSSYVPDLD